MGVFLFILFSLILIIFFPYTLRIKNDGERQERVTAGLVLFGVYLPFLHMRVALENLINLKLYKIKKKKEKELFSLLSREKPQKPFRLLRKGDIKSLALRIELGTGDAPATAILVSSLRTFGDIALKVTFKDKARIQVIPVFKGYFFKWGIDCIISLSIANIISRYFFEKREKHASDRKHT